MNVLDFTGDNTGYLTIVHRKDKKMNIIQSQIRKLLPLGILLLLILLAMPIKAQSVYTSEVIYTIHWGGLEGDASGGLSTKWNDIPISIEGVEGGPVPGPWAISNSMNLVIIDNGRILKYDSNGIFSGMYDIPEQDVGFIRGLAISDTGDVIFTDCRYASPRIQNERDSYRVFLLNTNMELVDVEELPTTPGSIGPVYPSNSDCFYVLYTIKNETPDRYQVTWNERLLYRYHFNGVLDPPEVVWSGYSDDFDARNYFYASPDGQIFEWCTDEFGYTYRYQHFLTLVKYNPSESLDFTLILEDDENWSTISHLASYNVMYTGDIFTLHATDAGAVLTKYTLQINNPPVCAVNVQTSMPYNGTSPAEIQFDACMSYDPDAGDIITYEWDFDGDGIYSEPVDDAYTGDPDNPTHSYTETYVGDVFLKVTDLQDEFSICTVFVEVFIE